MKSFQYVEISTIRTGNLESLALVDLPRPITRNQRDLYCKLFSAGLGCVSKVLLVTTGAFNTAAQEN